MVVQAAPPQEATGQTSSTAAKTRPRLPPVKHREQDRAARPAKQQSQPANAANGGRHRAAPWTTTTQAPAQDKKATPRTTAETSQAKTSIQQPSRSAGHQQRQKGSRTNQDHPAATTGVARWQQLEARRRTLQGEDTCNAATQGKHGSGPARRRHSQRQRQRRRACHDDKLDDSAR